MQIVSPSEYVAQATDLINKATSRVSLIAMVIADHPETEPLIAALKHAAERGVLVTVAADIFTYGEVSGGFVPLRYYSIGSRQATAMAKSLKAAGVHFEWLGRNHALIMTGRTHSKWCVVDDTSFVFGGVNLYDEGIKNSDYMFCVKDKNLADRLHKEQRHIHEAERTFTNFTSSRMKLPNGIALFDGGIMGHSVIYQHAVALAKKAQHVTFVSQYCPTGRLGRILKKKNTDFYFNLPENAPGFNKYLIKLSMFFTGIQTKYAKTAYLHGKFIIFTMPDGTKTAITGSHNFAYTGVLFGTREVALETSDPIIINQLEAFYQKNVA